MYRAGRGDADREDVREGWLPILRELVRQRKRSWEEFCNSKPTTGTERLEKEAKAKLTSITCAKFKKLAEKLKMSYEELQEELGPEPAAIDIRDITNAAELARLAEKGNTRALRRLTRRRTATMLTPWHF